MRVLIVVVFVVLVVLPAAAQPGAAVPSVAADPVPRRARYVGLVRAMSARHGLDPALVDAVIRTESSYRPDAVSSAGAVGLMQLMPRTARAYGVRNRFDPVQNVAAGTAYLADLIREFGPGGARGLVSALAAYNAGPAAVRRHGGMPPYEETRIFVARVLVRYLGARP